MWDDDILAVPFVPRRHPLPIPDTLFSDEPTNAAGINHKWLSHIYGALEVLMQADSWQGTDDEIRDAIESIELWLEGFIV